MNPPLQKLLAAAARDGKLFFVCIIHPRMQGKIEVVPST
jgi:hypothetical protein